MSWTYIKSEPSLWTVGQYRPDGTFDPESDHGDPDEAAARVRYLNGGSSPEPATEIAIPDSLRQWWIKTRAEIDAAREPDADNYEKRLEDANRQLATIYRSAAQYAVDELVAEALGVAAKEHDDRAQGWVESREHADTGS